MDPNKYYINDFETEVLNGEKPTVLAVMSGNNSDEEHVIKSLVQLEKEYEDVNVKLYFLKQDSFLLYRKYLQERMFLESPTVASFFKGNVLGKSEGFHEVHSEKQYKYIFKKAQTEFQKSKQTQPDSLALTLIGNEIKLISLTSDGEYKFVDNTREYHQIFYNWNFDKVKDLLLIEEFEYLINSQSTTEHDLQVFFQRNPDFIMNDDYKQIHSQVIIRNEDNNAFIPDFVLEPYDTSKFCDLLDIKLPKAKTYIMKKNRARYSSDVLEAAAQLREYSNLFEGTKVRNQIETKYGLNLYKPKMIVIIGRNDKYDPILKRRAQMDLPLLDLHTYDEVLTRYKIRKSCV